MDKLRIQNIKEKANRCLQCKTKPCMNGCPLENNIPQFIAYVRNEEYKKAYEVLEQTTIMPFICGRICPKSKQCQGQCIRGIKGEPVSIGDIEALIGDIAIKNKWYIEKRNKNNGKTVAIIGAGPAGINCSIELARQGYTIDLYEKQNKIGGILRYGIPDFRLNKSYIDILQEKLLGLDVTIYNNKMLGRDFTIPDLIKKYNYVILDIGANCSCKMNIKGEQLPNVLGANELLEYQNHPDYINKKVIIIGGGNVAIDMARVAKQKGAKEVKVFYRRARKQMPAEDIEIEQAIQEGIEFLYQVNVKEIYANKIICSRNLLLKKEGEQRETPIEIENSEFKIEADYVIMAIGSKLNDNIIEQGIVLNSNGYIKVDDNFMTNIKNVYAIGDCIGNKSTVAWAARTGRNLAKKISLLE